VGFPFVTNGLWPQLPVQVANARGVTATERGPAAGRAVAGRLQFQNLLALAAGRS
jgi:hypothetical protein